MPCHFGAWAGLGHCYAHEGRLAEAVEAYERALEINPIWTASGRRSPRCGRGAMRRGDLFVTGYWLLVSGQPDRREPRVTDRRVRFSGRVSFPSGETRPLKRTLRNATGSRPKGPHE